MPHPSHRHLSTSLCLVALIVGRSAPLDAAEGRSAVALQELINGLKTQLGIDAVVSAAVVTTNTLLVSVRPVDGDAGRFQMAFEERFLATVDEDELTAIVAHEIGHVWIFSHDQYLTITRIEDS